MKMKNIIALHLSSIFGSILVFLRIDQIFSEGTRSMFDPITDLFITYHQITNPLLAFSMITFFPFFAAATYYGYQNKKKRQIYWLLVLINILFVIPASFIFIIIISLLPQLI